MVELRKLIDRSNLKRRNAVQCYLPHDLQHHRVPTLPADHHQGLVAGGGDVPRYGKEFGAALAWGTKDLLFRATPPFMETSEEGTHIAESRKSAASQASMPLSVIHAQHLSPQLHANHQLLLQLWRQHRVWNPARQRHRKQLPGTHGKRRDEALIAGKCALALDDVQELSSLLRCVENRGACETCKDKAARAHQKCPQVLQLHAILRLSPHQIMRLVHDHNFVHVHVASSFLVAYLHHRRYRDVQTLSKSSEIAASRSVAQRSHRGRRHLLVWVLPPKSGAQARAHSSQVEHVLHLQHLAERVAEPSKLILWESVQLPHTLARFAPIPTAASCGCFRGP
mmetsp:Transcript_151209/g.275106  ORF Transcript_151209/g.275106 Transcript_151209/m.275106 type:complete len:339 (+) Transcript_151209:369-1385(+)